LIQFLLWPVKADKKENAEQNDEAAHPLWQRNDIPKNQISKNAGANRFKKNPYGNRSSI